MRIITFIKGKQEIQKFPNRPDIEQVHIQFETTKLEELLEIARYRIINFPTTIILDKRDRVLLRVRGNVTDEYLGKFNIN